MLRHRLVVLTMVVLVLVASAANAKARTTAGLSASDVQSIRHSADYILRCQMPNGFIPMTEGEPIWGVSCFGTAGALGLLRSYQVTGDQRYLKGAKRFADWYAGHMEPSGVMCDWKGTRNAPESTGDYDSSDGYSPDFIVLCYDIFRITHDRAWLKAKYPAIARSVKGMLLTLQSDGLTFAKPTYKVKYLMDNISVHYGLRGAILIAKQFKTPDAAKWQKIMDRNQVGLRKFWLSREGRFSPAIFEDGVIDKDWAKWYPDGMANASALTFMLDKQDPKAKRLYHQLNAKFSENDYFQAVAVWKFGSKAAARKIISQFPAPKHMLDHSNYIRALVPQLDGFFYSDDKLSLPNLMAVKAR